MASQERHVREPPGNAGRRKQLRGVSDTKWLRDGRYPVGRLEVHPIKPGEDEGYVYIFKDAKGLVKVGFAFCAIRRFKVLRSQVARDHMPLRFVRAIRIERSAARRAEALAHRALSPFDAELVFSEWYRADVAAVLESVDAAVADALAGAPLPIRRGWVSPSGVRSRRRGLQLTDGERATLEALWFSPRFATDLERLTAIRDALGRRITPGWCRAHLGSPYGRREEPT